MAQAAIVARIGGSMVRRRFSLRAGVLVSAVCTAAVGLSAAGGVSSIRTGDLKEWLSYVASDELQGRAVYTAGIGLAAAYIKDHLKLWGLKPAGDQGHYLQTVRVLGIKTTSHASVTVDVNGETRTFDDGGGVTLPKNMGGKRRFTIDRVEFAGYGLDAPAANHIDFRGKNVKDAVVVWLGATGPKGLDPTVYRRLLAARNRYATGQLGAAAAIGQATPAGGRGARGEGAATAASPPASGGGRGTPLPTPDFTTVQRLDAPIAPAVTADDSFFTFLFSHAPAKYDALKRKAADQEPLPQFTLDGVKITFNIDAEYQVVRTQVTQNVVAKIDGSDSQ